MPYDTIYRVLSQFQYFGKVSKFLEPYFPQFLKIESFLG